MEQVPIATLRVESTPVPSGTTLDQLLRTLGSGVLRVLAAPAGTGVPVTGIAIHDEVDPPAVTRGTLVLGIGLRPGAELGDLMDRLAGEAAILVTKVSPQQERTLADEAERRGLAVVAVAHGAAWMQIAALLSSAMNVGPVGREGEGLGGAGAGDLFAVANAVSALVDAPVTIEDPQARVIAFSARQDEADEARMITILGRQVPDSYFRSLQASGVFRRLNRERTPLYIDDIGPGVLPRLAVAVLAGDEVLGSIWAAVREKPSQERIDDFARAASFVAIHLLRHRLASDVQRGLQTELVSAVLGGGPLAADAARRLGLAGDSFRVLAVGMRRGDAIDNELSLARCWDALSLHLSAVHRRATSAVIGGVVYAVLPAAADAESSRRIAREAAEGFLARLQPALRDGALIAAGGHAPRLEGIPASRQDADRVLRVLRDSNRDDRAFADIEQMHVHVLLDRLGEVAADDPASPSGPLRTLLERDARQGTRLAETLRAYLDAFGDVNLAAERLGIHHNTLRYRLERVREIPGLDLTDPELRLALQLQLRWLPRAEEEARTTAAGRRPRRR